MVTVGWLAHADWRIFLTFGAGAIGPAFSLGYLGQ